MAQLAKKIETNEENKAQHLKVHESGLQIVLWLPSKIKTFGIFLKHHVKHLYSLKNKKFQEHYS